MEEEHHLMIEPVEYNTMCRTALATKGSVKFKLQQSCIRGRSVGSISYSAPTFQPVGSWGFIEAIVGGGRARGSVYLPLTGGTFGQLFSLGTFSVWWSL